MIRRELIERGLAAIGAGLLLSRGTSAGSGVYIGGPLAGAVYYTQESPGRWVSVVAEHLPRIDAASGAGGTTNLSVVTEHEMNGYEHYIVKHMLLNNRFQIVGDKRFNPKSDRPVSLYTLPGGYKGAVYAVSMCNRHDVWLNGAMIGA